MLRWLISTNAELETPDLSGSTVTTDLSGNGGQTPDLSGNGGQTPDLSGNGGQTEDLSGNGGQTEDLSGNGGQTEDLSGNGGQTEDLSGSTVATKGVHNQWDRLFPGSGPAIGSLLQAPIDPSSTITPFGFEEKIDMSGGSFAAFMLEAPMSVGAPVPPVVESSRELPDDFIRKPQNPTVPRTAEWFEQTHESTSLEAIDACQGLAPFMPLDASALTEAIRSYTVKVHTESTTNRVYYQFDDGRAEPLTAVVWDAPAGRLVTLNRTVIPLRRLLNVIEFSTEGPKKDATKDEKTSSPSPWNVPSSFYGGTSNVYCTTRGGRKFTVPNTSVSAVMEAIQTLAAAETQLRKPAPAPVQQHVRYFPPSYSRIPYVDTSGSPWRPFVVSDTSGSPMDQFYRYCADMSGCTSGSPWRPFVVSDTSGGPVDTSGGPTRSFFDDEIEYAQRRPTEDRFPFFNGKIGHDKPFFNGKIGTPEDIFNHGGEIKYTSVTPLLQPHVEAPCHGPFRLQSSVLRNANLQLRTEAPCPTEVVSPFNRSTIGPQDTTATEFMVPY